MSLQLTGDTVGGSEIRGGGALASLCLLGEGRSLAVKGGQGRTEEPRGVPVALWDRLWLLAGLSSGQKTSDPRGCSHSC